MGTRWTASADLSSGATYYYAVRAEDATTGHGGSCRGGNEDANLVRLAAVPVGPPSPGTLRDDAGDTGAARFETEAPWTDAPTGGRLGTREYTAASSEGVCADLTSPILTLLVPRAGRLSLPLGVLVDRRYRGERGHDSGSLHDHLDRPASDPGRRPGPRRPAAGIPVRRADNGHLGRHAMPGRQGQPLLGKPG